MTKHRSFFCVLLLLILPVAAQEDTGFPHWETGNNLPALVRHISPQGNFAVAIENGSNVSLDPETLPDDDEYKIALWDLRGTFTDSHPDPIIERSFTFHPKEDFWFWVTIAFSPDDRYLAVRDNEHVYILTVPELELVKRIDEDIPISIEEDEVQWSADGRYVAFTGSPIHLMVWDHNSDTILSHRVKLLGPITPFDGGWLMKFPWASEEVPHLFVSCAIQLDTCETYSLDDLPIAVEHFTDVVIAADGRTVLTQAKDIEGEEQTWLWHWQDNGHWQVEDAPAPIGKITNRHSPVLSADSRYLAVENCLSQLTENANGILVPDCAYSIWEISSWTKVSTFKQFCDEFLFLPDDSNYFICYNDAPTEASLQLYGIQEATTIDYVRLDYVPAYDIPEQIDYSNVAISEAGNRILVTLNSEEFSRVTLAIPILHQDE